MLIKNAAILKLTSATLATFLYGTSYTLAAPVVLFGGQAATASSATDIDCVKVLAPALLRSGPVSADSRPLMVLGGDRIPITIDASACDGSIVDATQPWTILVMNKSGCQDNQVVFTDILMPGSTPEYTWVVQPTVDRAAVTTDPRLGIHIADESSRLAIEYYIRVQAANKGKQGLFVGRSNPFMIGPSLSKREDSTEANKLSTSTEEPSLPVADTNLADADLSTVPEPVAQESAPSSSFEPSGGLIDPTVPVAPITDAPVFPETPQDSPQDSPPVSTPTFHNPPMAVAEEVKKQTPGEIFLKYAAAGAGILSTIGVGVGGLLGGVVGGTVGLVLGLVVAAANASFYA